MPLPLALRLRCGGLAIGLAFPSIPAAAQQIVVTNYDDTRVVTYPLALLRGTLPSSATSLTVTNSSSTRPATQVMAGLARQGKFRALADLVPGENHLVLTSGAEQTQLTLRYVPQTNARLVRPMLYTLSDGDPTYSTPLANDPQNWQAKLGVMVKILQTFTAESMHDQGYPRLTFNLPMDPATGEVQVWKLVGEHDAAFYYNQAYNRDQLWSEAYSLIDRNLPDANAKNLVIIGFSKYDPALNYKYAHVALGGGHLGMMGSLSFWAYPDSIADILPTYMDGSTGYPAVQGEAATVHLTANDNIGAALHELGHALGRPHEGDAQSIMQRGFDRMYRFFTLAEPNGSTWAADQVGAWAPVSSAAFAAAHPWFAPPPPVARWDAVQPDPLPEALPGLTLTFDQPVTGLGLDDLSLTRLGEPVAGFPAQASLTSTSAMRYTVGLGSLADAEGEYVLTLHAGASGITGVQGRPLYDDQVRRWNRSAPTPPQWGPTAASVITSTTATLSATLSTTGGTATMVTAVYGTANAGTVTAAWTRVVELGEKARGPLQVAATGLAPDQIHYFRFSATNRLGTTWSPVLSFRTEKRAPSTDVTRPGYEITGSSSNFPAGESPPMAIDNLATTKYLNLDRLSTGFRIALPVARPVRALNLISANDFPGRDPASYILRGSHDGITYQTVAGGALTFPGRLASVHSVFPAPADATAYSHYELLFPTLASGAADGMQVAEAQLLEYQPMLGGAVITGSASLPIGGEGLPQLTDGRLETKMGVPNSQAQTLTITPSVALRGFVVKGLNLITGSDNATYTGRSPSSILLQGSSDGGVNYTTIYNKTGLTALNQNLLIDEHAFAENTRPYSRYRLRIGASPSGFTQVSELQVFGVPATPFETWVAGYALTDYAPEGDPDGDGAGNEEEYFHGSHPGVADAADRQVQATAESAGAVTLRFRTAIGRTYQVEYAPDLLSWQPAGPPLSGIGDQPAYQWIDDGTRTGGAPLPGTSRFYRVIVTITP